MIHALPARSSSSALVLYLHRVPWPPSSLTFFSTLRISADEMRSAAAETRRCVTMMHVLVEWIISEREASDTLRQPPDSSIYPKVCSAPEKFLTG